MLSLDYSLHLCSQQKATYFTKSKPKVWIQLNESHHTNKSLLKKKKQRKDVLVPSIKVCLWIWGTRRKEKTVYSEGRICMINEPKNTVWINMEPCKIENNSKRSCFHTIIIYNREVRPQPVEIIIDPENKLKLFALKSRGGKKFK